MRDNSHYLVAAQRKKRAELIEQVRTAIRALDRQGEPVSFASVVRASGVSRSFLNKLPELSDEIRSLRDAQAWPTATSAHGPAHVRRLQGRPDRPAVGGQPQAPRRGVVAQGAERSAPRPAAAQVGLQLRIEFPHAANMLVDAGGDLLDFAAFPTSTEVDVVVSETTSRDATKGPRPSSSPPSGRTLRKGEGGTGQPTG